MGKTAVGSYEARGKTLGIIGYGHIGTQLSILAEHLGMRVQFFDIEDKLVLGNSTQVKSLEKLLNTSDVVSLHVPETPQTQDMIGEKELSQMKKAAFLSMLLAGPWLILMHWLAPLKAATLTALPSAYSQLSLSLTLKSLRLRFVRLTT